MRTGVDTSVSVRTRRGCKAARPIDTIPPADSPQTCTDSAPKSGGSSEAAAPAAKDIYQAYFSRRGYSTR